MPSLKAPPTIDLDDAAFATACVALAQRAREFAPAAVVGIATGGVYVAEAMLAGFAEEPARVDFRLQRPGTAAKEALGAGKLLGRLPTRAANRLRWMEVALRERSLRRPDVPPPADEVQGHAATLDDVARATLAAAPRILVVDDTVDSGRTLTMTVAVVRSCSPDAEVRTAVLTSTWIEPPVTPDYSLHERTLLRFPWSFDS